MYDHTSNQVIPGVTVLDVSTGLIAQSDTRGFFTIDVPTLDGRLAFYKDGYGTSETGKSFAAPGMVVLLQNVENLSEVVIQNERRKFFALNKLKDVEETAIYAGKKTEVIAVQALNANKATNNTRQIFAQVTGLTINENSDGGLQLSIGGRGLDPNRTSNFNTRQNDYDISADVLGYPESYYVPPTEALNEIQIIRGAASLQYGTQFGGLVNFKLKQPSAKPLEIITRNTAGSFGLYTHFTSLSGTKGKFSYYGFFNYKQGDGYRPNSTFASRNIFVNLNYQFTAKTSLHFDYTMFDYLAQQPGGLTDAMFYSDPRQSNRKRNWFDVNWNLYALRFKHRFSNEADFSLQLFGLDASRKALGLRTNRVSNIDSPGNVRDLITGDFVNWGAEARYLQRYELTGKKNTFLIGAKYYQARNKGAQGPGSAGSGPDFHFANTEFPQYDRQSSYTYPNLNVALFGENIFRLSEKWSVTPGFRIEKIRTQAEGYYRRINTDLAGNILLDETTPENNVKDRELLLLGVGVSYKPRNGMEFFGNISQNYRSVTFNDIRTASASQAIAPDITDERGFTSDIGIRGNFNDKVSYNAGIYGLFYNDKIGEYMAANPNGGAATIRFRDNIGTAFTYGFEGMAEWNLAKTFFPADEKLLWNFFGNLALTDSRYLKSEIADVEGNKVEFVPFCNLKTGTGIGYGNFVAGLQFTYVSSQFTDAGNEPQDRGENESGIFGEIPAYYVADFSASYKWKQFRLEGGINNFTDNAYFTRRALGYPGPGIIPSDGRSFYLTLEIKVD